ncbi:glycogen synthase GlgA [Caldichromatium japonicum]|uniref:Glycogen synthase n=1 Tax=Caldichromatium japonicum TaxID=2699430 RepID=A0A6G7VG33_9GAMM|nr:glycogen synthase GlgA [Caldichromatium japonicum]QIK38981.1 glycogen synthase GlgA [Caldichromatium japonicum]
MEPLSAHPLSPQASPLRVLFASSEAHPLIKTGGLADVAASLPIALRGLGVDVRLVLPGYPSAMRQVREPRPCGTLVIPGYRNQIRLVEGLHPDAELLVYLIDAPEYFAREGNPYSDPTGRDWGDNADRFMLFCCALVLLARAQGPIDWQPDLFHGNDWQTGLAPWLLNDGAISPARVFTIHNLAYQGLFDRATFDRLRLPPSAWSISGLEFHQRLSFIKGGILCSERVNTVSPTYADEVRTPRFGCGLDGLLRELKGRFCGILNGIDDRIWDPAHDPLIAQPYNAENFALKAENKLAIQRALGLPRNEEAFALGYIGRLVEQKGVDLIIAILPELIRDPLLQVLILAAGDLHLEQALLDLAAAHPRQVGVFIGYDERLSHQIEAGCDAFLMPSRFEPCGLNQLYSLRYGTPPIVHRTGGLADTVVSATEDNLSAGTATGFVFTEPRPEALFTAIDQARRLYRTDPESWHRLALTGMAQDFSWTQSAQRYLALYHEALADRLGPPPI